MLSLYNTDNRPTEVNPFYNIKLETNSPITQQNIYKAFCKFFLSVIDKEDLQYFEKTINWINGTIKIKDLPKISELISYHSFSMHPKLIVYMRKSEDKKLPFAVGEFYFTCKLFVFIIPLSNQDNLDFTIQKDFEHYWKTFQHYKKTSGWAFRDYSIDVAREFIMNLNFEMNDKKDN